MTFIALGPPDRNSQAASASDPGINVDTTPFGLNVAPSAEDLAGLLAGLSTGGMLSVAREDGGELVYVNPAAILYFTD